MSVKNKRILRQIAKDVVSKHIDSLDGFAFEEVLEAGLLDEQEVDFILEHCQSIANKLSETTAETVKSIVAQYFTVE